MIRRRVVNCNSESYDIYIGRGSKWGNPYHHKSDSKYETIIVGSRKEAIESYRKWITEGEGRHLLNDLHELKGKILGCWCKPKRCHGDVLIELIDKYCN